MMREYQVRICERLRVKFPGPTRQTEKNSACANVFRVTPESGHCSIQSACLKGAKTGSRFSPCIPHHARASVAAGGIGELALERAGGGPFAGPFHFGRYGGQHLVGRSATCWPAIEPCSEGARRRFSWRPPAANLSLLIWGMHWGCAGRRRTGQKIAARWQR